MKNTNKFSDSMMVNIRRAAKKRGGVTPPRTPSLFTCLALLRKQELQSEAVNNLFNFLEFEFEFDLLLP